MREQPYPALAGFLVVLALAPTVSATCWRCTISGSVVQCQTASSTAVGEDSCADGSSCGASGCSTMCLTVGPGCTGGTGGNCRVLADGTVICEEHRSLRTTNGETWPRAGEDIGSSLCRMT